MLIIRLQRAGKRNQPEYRIVLAEKPAAASKRFIEVLGNYNPRTKHFLIADENRLQYWIGQHVELSPTIHNLFVTKNLISSAKVHAFRAKKKADPAAAQAPAPAATAPAEPAAAQQATAEASVPAETAAPAEAPAEQPKAAAEEIPSAP